MHWLWLLACGTPAPSDPAVEPGPVVAEASAVATAPTAVSPADAVLDRHNQVTKQCALLDRLTWRFEWEATTKDGHAAPSTSRIQYQGRNGLTFTRAQQQTAPAMRFVAFGRTPQGKYWSAGDGGVQADLPEAVSTPMAAAIDPTPLCAYLKRWPIRTLQGDETYQGQEASRVELQWADGSTTSMWFSKAEGMLIGSRSQVGDTITETTLHDYAEHAGVLWPGREVAKTKAGPLEVETEQVLSKLELDPKDYRPIGPEQVARILGVALAPTQGP